MAKGSNNNAQPSEFVLWLATVDEGERERVAEVIASLDVSDSMGVAKASIKLMAEVARGRLTPAIASELRELLALSFEALTFEATLKSKSKEQVPNIIGLLLRDAQIHRDKSNVLEGKTTPEIMQDMSDEIDMISKELLHTKVVSE